MADGGLHPAAVAATTSEARSGRSDADRAMVADPMAARRGTKLLLDSDRPGREELIVAGFERAYRAFGRRDWEMNTLYFNPHDYVFRAADLREALPDAQEEYVGVPGYLRAMNLFLESWDDLRLEQTELLELRADRVVSLVRFTGHGRSSGVAIDQPSLVSFRFGDDGVFEQTYSWDVARGMRAAGLGR